jgi:2,5-furandicarboxylate decarboxylase 1
LHAVISLSGPRAGDAKKAIFAVWAAVSLIKQVTIVDDDIDPWNGEEVERALATRMRPERDLTVIEGARADRAEPLERGGVIAKLGIDATRRAADRDDWTSARPPESVLKRVRQKLEGRRQ